MKLNNRGQVAVEYILITAVLFSIFLAVKKIAVGGNVVGNFVQKPWDVVAGMIETGVWGDPKTVRPQHPGHFARHNSFKGNN